jgi:proteasome lid subunit RPN8/RPN11
MTQSNKTMTPRSKPRRHPLLDGWMEHRRKEGPILRFTPTAWAKLHYFCHRGDTEIGGFAQTGADDLLLVEDFLTVRQRVSVASVAFDDTAVADLFESQVEAARKPEQFARIWLHTHPGTSPTPSSVDEETFARSFGPCDWAIMFILARGGKTYARLRFNIGPGGEVEIPVEVDYGASFGAADHVAWEAEYAAHIFPAVQHPSADSGTLRFSIDDPTIENRLLDELVDWPDSWDDDQFQNVYWPDHITPYRGD